MYSGKLFIIPNGISRLEETMIPDQRLVKKFGASTPMVQVWACNEDSENFCDHGMRGAEVEEMVNDCYQGFFPVSLPVSMFDGKVEGDEVELSFNGNDFKLTLCQDEFRYKSHGHFHEVLANLKFYYEKRKAA